MTDFDPTGGVHCELWANFNGNDVSYDFHAYAWSPIGIVAPVRA